MNISDLRRVRLFFREGGNPTEYFMHASQVEACMAAAVELHYAPGKNPYTKGTTAELWRIEVAVLSPPSAYWHTTPGLGLQDQAGAEVSRWMDQRAWTHPELAKEEEILNQLD